MDSQTVTKYNSNNKWISTKSEEGESASQPCTIRKSNIYQIKGDVVVMVDVQLEGFYLVAHHGKAKLFVDIVLRKNRRRQLYNLILRICNNVIVMNEIVHGFYSAILYSKAN